MKILITDKYDVCGDSHTQIERYICYFGSKEGEYHASEKGGIDAKIKDIRNGKLHYYGSYCCTGALTKYGVIQDFFGGNGYVDGHVPDQTVQDLELGITWTAADYMMRHGLTKLEGGCIAGEKIFNDIYGANVNYVERGSVVTNTGFREYLFVLAKRMTPERLKEIGVQI